MNFKEQNLRGIGRLPPKSKTSLKTPNEMRNSLKKDIDVGRALKDLPKHI